MVYLSEKELSDAYHIAKNHAQTYFDPMKEWERLAANKVRSDLPANLPKVNDGSLAALLMETPMRVFSTMPKGEVTLADDDRDEEWLSVVAEIILNKKIIPYAITDADAFSKLQTMVYKALIYGGQPAFSFFTQHGKYATSDFTLPYVQDVILETGKNSDLASDHIWMKSYFTKLQIKSLIKRGKKEDTLAKEQKRESFNTWDLKGLQKILDSNAFGGKDAQAQSFTKEKHGQHDQQVATFTSCFQRGFEAPFTTFAPEVKGMVVRRAKNTNPCGDLPITYMYAFQDFENPYGRGQVELSGGTQNVLDYFTQADMLSTQLSLEPPLKIAGPRDGLNLNSLTFSRRQFWFTGNATVEPVSLNTSAYSQFPERYGLYKTQLLNLQGTTDASVSAESGAPGFSKTDAGVKLQERRANAHDNFILQRAQHAWERIANNLINIYMSNKEGEETMELIDSEAERLMKAGLIDEDPETAKPSAEEVKIKFDNVRAQYKYTVSVTNDNDKEQRDGWTELLGLVANTPEVLALAEQSGQRVNVGEMLKQIMAKSGLDEWEKVIEQVDESEVQAQEEQALLEQQALAQQQQQVPVEQPLPQQPIAPAPQPQPDPVQDFVAQAQASGFSDDQIAQVLVQEGAV